MKRSIVTLRALLLAPLAVLHAEDSRVLWIEAEHYVAQDGSQAAKFEMPGASGGACVDNGWGGQEGHFLRDNLELAAGFPALHLTLRYASQTAGDAVVRVTLDGDTNKSALVKLPSTGGWNFGRLRSAIPRRRPFA